MTHRNTEQPKNSINLMNGEALECCPKQSPKTKFASDKMQLNTTGAYLDMGIKPCKPRPNADEEKERQKKLFTDNAFYLLAHSERIMRDSRMFLAPVDVFKTDSHRLAHQASIPLQWAYIWNGGQLAQKHCAQIKKVVEVLSFTWQAAR